jgi:murein DD-endopeptidase MepM/ murein hydrolase activator NlpD
VTHIIPTPTRSLENCAPAGMPLSGPLTQRFHYRHIGIDIGVPIGTPVLTTHSGRVTYAGWSDRGYGNLVVVENGRFSTYYGHFDTVYVAVGQWVDSGGVLGLSGNTGNSTGPHLHYETRIDDVPVDPLTFELRGYPHC